ncbi:MAG TPA: MFS transporter, partial [Rhodospirillaceae bacterium]|nr:MFS transporter [Rhodospirillaceae bacterium]
MAGWSVMADSIAKESVRQVNRPAILSWCLYDWANSAFNTVIGTFIFSVYFAKGIYGDATGGSVVWGYAIGGAGLVVALLGPVVGAVADHSGRHKSWVASATGVTVLATAALYFAEPDQQFVLFALVLVVIATIAFELGAVFYNATLHAVAPPGMLGRVSGWGWATGYFGGLGCLGLGLVALVQPEVPWFGFAKEGAENIRATAPLVALWFGLFALPFFIFVPAYKGDS